MSTLVLSFLIGCALGIILNSLRVSMNDWRWWAATGLMICSHFVGAMQ
jgi:hypothetical protein